MGITDITLQTVAMVQEAHNLGKNEGFQDGYIIGKAESRGLIDDVLAEIKENSYAEWDGRQVIDLSTVTEIINRYAAR